MVKSYKSSKNKNYYYNKLIPNKKRKYRKKTKIIIIKI